MTFFKKNLVQYRQRNCCCCSRAYLFSCHRRTSDAHCWMIDTFFITGNVFRVWRNVQVFCCCPKYCKKPKMQSHQIWTCYVFKIWQLNINKFSSYFGVAIYEYCDRIRTVYFVSIITAINNILIQYLKLTMGLKKSLELIWFLHHIKKKLSVCICSD